MSQRNNRDLYYSKHIEPCTNQQDFLNALLRSPYRTHRREGRKLIDQLKNIQTSKEGDE